MLFYSFFINPFILFPLLNPQSCLVPFNKDNPEFALLNTGKPAVLVWMWYVSAPPPRLTHFYTWSPAGDTVLESCGTCKR